MYTQVYIYYCPPSSNQFIRQMAQCAARVFEQMLANFTTRKAGEENG